MAESRAPTNGIWPPPPPIERKTGIAMPQFRNADQTQPTLLRPVGALVTGTPSTPAQPSSRLTENGGDGMMGSRDPYTRQMLSMDKPKRGG
jgi:hypothetical protein